MAHFMNHNLSNQKKTKKKFNNATDEIKDKVIRDIERTLKSNASENEISKKIQTPQLNMQMLLMDVKMKQIIRADFEILIENTKRTLYSW